MISFFEASLKSLSVHHTGNKIMDQYYKLSDAPLAITDEVMQSLLLQFFLKPFEKSNEVYRLHHPSNVALNDVHHIATEMFNNNYDFHQGSEEAVRHLYDVATHPKIKSGEFYMALFENVQIEGELLDAIGIFKSETKDTYLNVYPELDGFGISYKQDGISINKLDKGCLIFNTDAAEGYKVVVFDQAKNLSAIYWKDEFLGLTVRNDDFTKTSNVMGVFKTFVTDKLDEVFDIPKSDKIDLLNKSLKYFKEKEAFDAAEFGQEVIGNPEGIELFSAYKKDYAEEFETDIPDSFEISDPAVKAKISSFKAELKLDKNFKILISGSKDLIEKGFDEDKSLNYYKLYFKEEQ